MVGDGVSRVEIGDLVFEIKITTTCDPEPPPPPRQRKKRTPKSDHWQTSVRAAQASLIDDAASCDDTLLFHVHGNSPEPYRVVFLRNGSNLMALCSCPASSNGYHCKHRIGLLMGDPVGVRQADREKITLLQSWLEGTDVQAALRKFQEASKASRSNSPELRAAKKALANAMHD